MYEYELKRLRTQILHRRNNEVKVDPKKTIKRRITNEQTQNKK